MTRLGCFRISSPLEAGPEASKYLLLKSKFELRCLEIRVQVQHCPSVSGYRRSRRNTYSTCGAAPGTLYRLMSPTSLPARREASAALFVLLASSMTLLIGSASPNKETASPAASIAPDTQHKHERPRVLKAPNKASCGLRCRLLNNRGWAEGRKGSLERCPRDRARATALPRSLPHQWKHCASLNSLPTQLQSFPGNNKRFCYQS